MVVFPVVCDMYGSTVDASSILLVGSEQTGGEAGGFKCSRAGQVKVSLGEESKVFVMFASLKLESEVGVRDLLMVREFHMFSRKKLLICRLKENWIL